MLASPAGAEVAAKNAKFCAVLYGDQGGGINFEGLGPDEAKFAAKLERKLAKTGVPAKLKSDLLKLAKVYDRIAKGEDAGKVVVDVGDSVTKGLVRFSKYVQANCTPPVPVT